MLRGGRGFKKIIPFQKSSSGMGGRRYKGWLHKYFLKGSLQKPPPQQKVKRGFNFVTPTFFENFCDLSIVTLPNHFLKNIQQLDFGKFCDLSIVKGLKILKLTLFRDDVSSMAMYPEMTLTMT